MSGGRGRGWEIRKGRREGGLGRTFENVKHARHLTENQHPMTLLLELFQQFVCKDGNQCDIGPTLMAIDFALGLY